MLDRALSGALNLSRWCASHALRTRRCKGRGERLPVLFRALRSLSVSLVVWGLTLTAAADATVIVDLKRQDGSAVEGTVQLTKGETQYRCDTDKAGRCALKNVAGGIYQVTVTQGGKPGAKSKTAVIPPSGEVKLIVNAE